MRRLLQMHTEETGQVFAPEAMESIWYNTQGQPWLVNALAYEVTYKIEANRDRSVIITKAMIEQARENLIRNMDENHLGELFKALDEPEIHRILETILEGKINPMITIDDIDYASEIGLIERRPQMRITNPIYRDIVLNAFQTTAK